MIDANYASALIALFVSALFGLAAHIQRLGLDYVDARTGAIVNVGTTAAIATVLAPLYVDWPTTKLPSVALFALAGLVVPGVSLSVSTFAIRLIGPSLTSGLASTSPVFAMLLAIVLVGELVTTQIAVGTLIVVAGVALVAMRPSKSPISWPYWAIGLPLVAALARGIAHPVVKLGLLGMPSPMTAMLVSSMVSIVVIYSLFRLQGHVLPAWNRGYLWFALCGVINCIGLVCLNVALQIGEVIIVSPLIAATPVFTLLASYLYFKREVITGRILCAIVMIVIGCALITIR